MNAIDLILDDHKKIRALLSQSIKRATTHITDRKSILLNISTVLILHEKMEQLVWYPLINAPAYKTVIKHLLKEEQDADKAINKLKKIDPKTDKWLHGLKKLQKDVLHHANEEQTKLLPKVKENLSSIILKYIGSEMLEFKNKHAKGLQQKTKKTPKKKAIKK